MKLRRREAIKLRIREIRKQQGFSQQEFAKILDIDQGTLSRYETSDYDIRFSTLCYIAKKLDVPVTMLFVSNESHTSEREMEEPANVS